MKCLKASSSFKLVTAVEIFSPTVIFIIVSIVGVVVVQRGAINLPQVAHQAEVVHFLHQLEKVRAFLLDLIQASTVTAAGLKKDA